MKRHKLHNIFLCFLRLGTCSCPSLAGGDLPPPPTPPPLGEGSRRHLPAGEGCVKASVGEPHDGCPSHCSSGGQQRPSLAPVGEGLGVRVHHRLLACCHCEGAAAPSRAGPPPKQSPPSAQPIAQWIRLSPSQGIASPRGGPRSARP